MPEDHSLRESAYIDQVTYKLQQNSLSVWYNHEGHTEVLNFTVLLLVDQRNENYAWSNVDPTEREMSSSDVIQHMLKVA